MKNIFKISLIGLILFGTTISCTDSDLAIDTLYDTVDTSGAILRILEFPDDLVNSSGNPPLNNTMNFLMEVQQGDGSFTPDFKEVRVYLSSFDDQDQVFPTSDASGNPLGELLFRTIPESEFAEISSVNGLPQTSLMILTQEFKDSFPTAVLTIPTFIVIRFELEMSDGRVWNDTNAGTTLSGPYLSSPFTRTVIFLNI